MFSIENSKNKIVFDDNIYYLLEYDLGNSTANFSTSNYVGQNGVFINSSNLEPRVITLKGAICSDDDLKEAKKSLTNMINPLQDLIFRNGKYSIECRPNQTIKFNYEEILDNYIPFLIELYCPSPFWNDEEDNIISMSSWDNLFEFEFEIPTDGMEFATKNESTLKNIVNENELDTGFKVTAKCNAEVTNFSITNIYTNEIIKINKTLKGGEVITINTEYGKKRIESSVDGNVINYLDIDSSFFQLHKGDNWLKINADTGLDSIVCDIQITDKIFEV